MGCNDFVDYNRWPRQGSLLGKRVHVLYHYGEPPNGGPRPTGIVVRDDVEGHGITIIKMDEGDRYLIGDDCQFSPIE